MKHSWLTRGLNTGRRGAGAITYGLIVGLVAVFSITAVERVGLGVESLFGNVADEIAPRDGVGGVPDGTGEGDDDAPDVTPDGFGFINKPSVLPGLPHASDVVQLTGFNQPISLSLTDGSDPSAEFQVCATAFVYTCPTPKHSWGRGPAEVDAGDFVQVRMTAGNNGAFGETFTATLSAGGVSADWSITTPATGEDVDASPDPALAFVTDDAPFGEIVSTDIRQVTGITDGIDICFERSRDDRFCTDTADDGEVRVCADSGCQTVITDYTPFPVRVDNGVWIQLRARADGFEDSEIKQSKWSEPDGFFAFIFPEPRPFIWTLNTEGGAGTRTEYSSSGLGTPGTELTLNIPANCNQLELTLRGAGGGGSTSGGGGQKGGSGGRLDLRLTGVGGMTLTASFGGGGGGAQEAPLSGSCARTLTAGAAGIGGGGAGGAGPFSGGGGGGATYVLLDGIRIAHAGGGGGSAPDGDGNGPGAISQGGCGSCDGSGGEGAAGNGTAATVLGAGGGGSAQAGEEFDFGGNIACERDFSSSKQDGSGGSNFLASPLPAGVSVVKDLIQVGAGGRGGSRHAAGANGSVVAWVGQCS